MSDKKLWEQYVALEKERDALRSDLAEFQYGAAVANDTIKALQAKVEQMERQEPVAFALYSGWAFKAAYRKEHEACDQRDRRQLSADLGGSLEAYRVVPLYALPGAQIAPSVPGGWLHHAARMAALARKLREPDWHFESIREMQRELCALEEAALAAAPEARQ